MSALIVIAVLILIPVVIGVMQYSKYPKPPSGMTYDELCEYYYTRAWEKKKSVREYVEAGEKLQAIKELRNQTGCSLADAKFAVEQLEISVKRRTASSSSNKDN